MVYPFLVLEKLACQKLREGGYVKSACGLNTANGASLVHGIEFGKLTKICGWPT